jgi:hypothetical protein
MWKIPKSANSAKRLCGLKVRRKRGCRSETDLVLRFEKIAAPQLGSGAGGDRRVPSPSLLFCNHHTKIYASTPYGVLHTKICTYRVTRAVYGVQRNIVSNNQKSSFGRRCKTFSLIWVLCILPHAAGAIILINADQTLMRHQKRLCTMDSIYRTVHRRLTDV